MSICKLDNDSILRDYLIVTNKGEIRDRIKELGITNYLLIEDDLPNEDEVDKMLQFRGKACIFVMYFNKPVDHRKLKFYIDKNKIQGFALSNMIVIPIEDIPEYSGTEGFLDENDYLPEAMPLGRFLEIIDRIIEYIDRRADSRGWILYTDYKDRCGNCHEKLNDHDNYCTVCGTKRGEGRFIPYENQTYSLYGSWVLYKMKCLKCGKQWVVSTFDRSFYCTECGGKACAINLKEIDPFQFEDDFETEMMAIKQQLMEDD